MRPILFSVVLFVLTIACDTSKNTCTTPEDGQWYALIDQYEELAYTGELDSLDALVLQLQKDSSAYPLAYAYSLYRRGVVEHNKDAHQAAIPWYKRALSAYCACDDAPLNRISRLYANIAQKYTASLRQPHLGYTYAQAGISFFEKSMKGQTAILQEDYYELHLEAGKAKQRLGNGTAALDYFALAGERCDLDSIPYYLKSQLAKGQSMAFKDLQELDSALFYIQQAEQIILAEESLIYFDSTDLAGVYNDALLVYMDREEDSLALSSIEQSMSINQALSEQHEYAVNLVNYARVLMRLEQYQLAYEALQEALLLNEQKGYEEGEAQVYNYLGQYYAQAGQPEEALAAYNQTIAILKRAHSDIMRNPYRQYLIYTMLDKFLLIQDPTNQLQEGQEASWEEYLELDQLLQSVRLDLVRENSKIIAQANIRPFYTRLISICHENWQLTANPIWLERALPYFVRSKSMVLQEGIEEGQMLSQILSEEDFDTYKTLQQQQGEYVRLLTDSLASNERNDIQRLEAEVGTRLNEFRDDLQGRYPQFRSYLSTLETPSLAVIQADLDPQESIIDYYVGEDELYILRVTADNTWLEKVQVSARELNKEVLALLESLVAESTPIRKDRTEHHFTYAVLANRLYSVLLAPIFDEGIRNQSLLIIPDGILARLPFEVLLQGPVPETSTSDFANYPFLLRDATISYQFSVTEPYRQGRKTSADIPLEILAVAPQQSTSVTIPLIRGRNVRLAPLNYSELEAQSFPDVFGLTALTGPRARKKEFINQASQYPIVHFAGHAMADENNPFNSFMAFDLETPEPTAELMFLPELYSLQLPATEMIVLSACQTGSGKVEEGEGVISLGRAVTMAGTAAVVSTLWVINQQNKAEFFRVFYEELAEGRAKQEALRAAKLQMMKSDNGRWAHPYHWAGAILTGNARPIKMPL